ncbi:RHS repeat domain-containing protein, partial [Morganella morganii]|uniref:RHS repeat domain-containing protein n=1 Tax=Morganella morganii TaxID=582 RepID=UPI0004A81610
MVRLLRREIEHEWDAQTDRLTQTRFGSQALQYQYGLQGELTQFQAGKHQPLQLSRNALGQEYLRHSQSGFASSRHYTATGILAHQTAGRGSDSYLQALRDNPVQPPAASDVNRSWQYDKAYNITAIDDHRWRRMQYRYNQNDQIENTSFGGLYPQTEQFSYDANLNIRQQTLIPGEAQGALHQLSQQQQAGRVVRRTTATGHFDYHYDINGRLERKTEHRNGFRPREWRYQWDTLNQLTSCFTPQGDCWRYTYDAFGRRLSKYQVVNAQEPVHLQHLNQPPVVRGWQYLWSGNQMIEEVPVYADGTVAYDAGVQWLYEPGALVPAARYEKGKLHYLVTDHQGTPREIFTETGTVSWAARPDTWGQMAFWSLKSSANDPNYTECHFRFAGQYEDAETGLYYGNPPEK